MQQKSILIIEQEESTINSLMACLSHDFKLIFVPFSRRALHILSEENVDLIILSRCLPDENSLEILAKIRRKYPQLPIVLIADSPNHSYIISAFRLGATDFFEKPLNENEFSKRLNNLLDSTHSGPFNSEHKIKKAIIQQELTNSRPCKKYNWFKSFWTFLISSKDSVTCLCTLQECRENTQKEGLPPNAVEIDSQNTRKTTESPGSKYAEIQSPSILFINYLGKFQVILNHLEINEWPGKKTEDVFAYLAYNHKRRIHRDVLMDRFWPNSSPDSARNCLNVTLHAIRKTFEEFDSTRDYICYKHECYFINPEIELKIDVEEFLLFWKLAQSTERENGVDAALSKYELAAAIYKGDFMSENFYGAWADLDRENLKEIYMEILNKLSNYYSLDGKPDVAIDLCDLMLKKDNCREDVHRRLMRCFYRVGQRDKAIRQFNKCAEILKSELKLSPSKATVQLLEKIRQNQ